MDQPQIYIYLLNLIIYKNLLPDKGTSKEIGDSDLNIFGGGRT